jgi:hypothetical protein
LRKKRVPGASFKIADFETYKFPDNIDIVFAFAAILHSDRGSVKDIFKKVSKSLNVGGVFFISSKYGPYLRKVIDRGGPKVNYLYTPEEIVELSPVNLRSVYSNVQEIRGQKWFEVILQKVN